MRASLDHCEIGLLRKIVDSSSLEIIRKVTQTLKRSTGLSLRTFVRSRSFRLSFPAT